MLAERQGVLKERSDALWSQLCEMDRRHAAERAPLRDALDAVLDALDDILDRRRDIKTDEEDVIP